MKKTLKNLLSVLSFTVVIMLISTSCEDMSYIKHTYTANIPVTYMTFAELRSAIKVENPQALKDPGKLFFKSNYIFVVEKYKGIHVIDNEYPSNPKNIAFIKVPGCVDISIVGNILYADSYTDLVAMDISDITNVTVTKRIEDAFEYKYNGYDSDYPVAQYDSKKGIVTEWEVKEITEKIETDNYPRNSGGGMSVLGAKSDTEVGYNYSGDAIGKAGSTARFITFSNYLYIIHNFQVEIYDISQPENPSNTNQSLSTSRNIETLFVYQNYLFIGSTTGMLIYSLSNPLTPTYVSSFDHATACDPVVVEGNYAYVTVRSGSSCGGFSDQLDIIDISNITYPSSINTYQLESPYGLGIDNKTLFICDGDAGLKILNVTNPYDIQIIIEYPGINAFDVIPFNNVLLMIGSDGLYQYDYSDINDIQLLSKIEIG
ncbi:MAG: hypothetical protein U9R42_13430 [Bacteroidota bacterium]|nr:hypothetical protein [Bacteroidota bacterium]